MKTGTCRHPENSDTSELHDIRIISCSPGAAVPCGNWQTVALAFRVSGCLMLLVAQYSLGAHSSLEHADPTVMMDNEALYSICRRNQTSKTPEGRSATFEVHGSEFYFLFF